MPLLDADRFLTELTKLYERHKTEGTVWVTMKRTNLRAGKAGAAKDGDPPDGGEDPDFRCLVRATDGKRKFSTALSTKQVARFHASYAIMQKAHFAALKQRQKEKTKPAGKAAAATPA